jgi:hypothetical protein
MSAVTVVVVSVPSVTLYVDGTQQATTPLLSTLAGYTAYAGYWHLGWAPPLSGVSNYFTGSVSNFVVFNTSPAPAAPTSAQRASQSAFTTWATAATERWLLNDSGTGTFGGPYPVITTTDPCTMVNVSWGFTNPTSCGWSPNSLTAACSDPPAASLSAFSTAPAQTIASPSPGATQTSTEMLSRGSTYNTGFLPGLRLYAPLSFRASTGGWVNTFTWTDATSAFTA